MARMRTLEGQPTASLVPTPSEAILVDIEREVMRRDGRRKGSEIQFSCPAHADGKRPAAKWSPAKLVWHCFSCGAGGGWIDLCQRLGIELERELVPVPKHVAPAGERAWDIGPGIAIHHRRDDGEGNKEMWWEWLGDKVEGRCLPFYRPAPSRGRVVVVEGEQAADALAYVGLDGAALVGGGSTLPTDDVLLTLKGNDVYLWPDNDAHGRSIMDRIAARLIDLDIKCSIINWPNAPEKGDAADLIYGLGYNEAWVTLVLLLDNAYEWASSGVEIFQAVELVAESVLEPDWAVPGLISVGLTFLAGQPKLGKSWLAYQLALSVAAGGKAFGIMPVERGEVLYLALEDTRARLKQRLTQLAQGEPVPLGLYLATEWPRWDDGGRNLLDRWLTDHPAARLVIIDTFQKVRSLGKREGNVYAEDYLAGAAVKELADQHNVAILVLHHTRKATKENGTTDQLEMVSGSNGLAGSADGIIVLARARNKGEAKLFVTGRDVEEQTLDLLFNPVIIWQCLSDIKLPPGAKKPIKTQQEMFVDGRW